MSGVSDAVDGVHRPIDSGRPPSGRSNYRRLSGWSLWGDGGGRWFIFEKMVRGDDLFEKGGGFVSDYSLGSRGICRMVYDRDSQYL